MNKPLMFNLLVSQFDCEYNSEYKKLSEEEKKCVDFVDKCLKETDVKFSDACTRAMLLILDALNKFGTEQELTKEETILQKKQLLSEFSKEEQERLELFMYACVQIIGIYSEESIEERKKFKDKMKSKTL